MDFVGGLPKTKGGRDTVCVILDHLTKSAHLFPVNKSNNADFFITLVCEENREDSWSTDYDHF